MIRKYHNHKLQTTPWHREEEPFNDHETPGRQIKQSNQQSAMRSKFDIRHSIFDIQMEKLVRYSTFDIQMEKLVRYSTFDIRHSNREVSSIFDIRYSNGEVSSIFDFRYSVFKWRSKFDIRYSNGEVSSIFDLPLLIILLGSKTFFGIRKVSEYQVFSIKTNF